MGGVRNAHIPEATVARLPVYLRCLTELAASGSSTTSSDVLADRAGVNAAKVRKDLSYLGTHGTRGVGYDVRHLVFEVSRALGVANTWPVLVCGLGNLGRALANHTGFTERGFPVVAAIEVDPSMVGSTIDGVPVHPPDRLAAVVAEHGVAIGVIATPGISRAGDGRSSRRSRRALDSRLQPNGGERSRRCRGARRRSVDRTPDPRISPSTRSTTGRATTRRDVTLVAQLPSRGWQTPFPPVTLKG